MLKRILIGLGLLGVIAAAGLAWSYWYYVGYDPPYSGTESGRLIEVHPEIHFGWDTPVLGAIITPTGDVWARVAGESCATINRIAAEEKTWGDVAAIAVSAKLFSGPGNCGGVAGVWWFVDLPVTASDLENRTLTGGDGTPLEVTDCRSADHTVKQGTICAEAAFPRGDEPGPAAAWGVTLAP